MHSPVHRERRLDRAYTHRRFLFSWSSANPRTSWLDSPPTKTTISLLWFVPIYRVRAHVYVSRMPEIICSLPAFSNTLPCHAITFIRVSEIKKRSTEESKAENRQICDQGYLQRNLEIAWPRENNDFSEAYLEISIASFVKAVKFVTCTNEIYFSSIIQWYSRCLYISSWNLYAGSPLP